MTKHGIISPTIDRLDTEEKYPIIRLDTANSFIYYIFKSDYTILKLDLKNDTTYVVSDYMPSKFRKRSISVDQVSTLSLWDAARKLGTNSSNLFAIEFIESDLLVVWYNLTDEFYDTRDDWNIDYYGVLFDLPDFRNPREFSLPGKLLGMYKNNLMILENDDPLQFTIGYYELLNR
ncbi:MAG: hypothetical protein EA364_05265 [Balneolaceae bacterium]|nr:MAG: hypothetical protein EA364_05265 [Balneolaceae bacterium]